jgi:hypothetical protein
MSEEKQEFWAVVEVMGHKVFPGRVSDQTLGSASFVRVDVPAVEPRQVKDKQRVWDENASKYTYVDFMREVEGAPAYTKIIGSGSIYCITPCTEEVARQVAEQRRERPVDIIDIARPSAMRALAASHDEDDEDDDEGDEYNESAALY